MISLIIHRHRVYIRVMAIIFKFIYHVYIFAPVTTTDRFCIIIWLLFITLISCGFCLGIFLFLVSFFAIHGFFCIVFLFLVSSTIIHGFFYIIFLFIANSVVAFFLFFTVISVVSCFLFFTVTFFNFLCGGFFTILVIFFFWRDNIDISFQFVF
ncbi:hypothetical protein HanIR_Chr13g0638211 [Helianthus annuus]|nr:hypothetical protein HanIR_Chr13g0638211 [Helianthus annuus]